MSDLVERLREEALSHGPAMLCQEAADRITELEAEVARLREDARSAIEAAGYRIVPVEPTEEQWGGLARDIMMWMSMYDGPKLTPRNLFSHLERIGREIPDWLREGEMSRLDHVPSKGTRCYIIYRAMIEAARKE